MFAPQSDAKSYGVKYQASLGTYALLRSAGIKFRSLTSIQTLFPQSSGKVAHHLPLPAHTRCSLSHIPTAGALPGSAEQRRERISFPCRDTESPRGERGETKKFNQIVVSSSSSFCTSVRLLACQRCCICLDSHAKSALEGKQTSVAEAGRSLINYPVSSF